MLAWTRTALAFGALGGAILKTTPGVGLEVLAMSPLIWVLGRLTEGRPITGSRPRRLQLITATIVAVAAAALVVAFVGHSGGSEGQLRRSVSRPAGISPTSPSPGMRQPRMREQR